MAAQLVSKWLRLHELSGDSASGKHGVEYRCRLLKERLGICLIPEFWEELVTIASHFVCLEARYLLGAPNVSCEHKKVESCWLVLGIKSPIPKKELKLVVRIRRGVIRL